MRRGLAGLLLVSHSLFAINRSVVPVLRLVLVPVHSWFSLQISQEPLCLSKAGAVWRAVLLCLCACLSCTRTHQCHLHQKQQQQRQVEFRWFNLLLQAVGGFTSLHLKTHFIKSFRFKSCIVDFGDDVKQ